MWALLAAVTPFVALPILEALQRWLTAGVVQVAEVVTRAAPMGVTSLGDGVFRAGGDHVSIAATCSGLESLSAVLLVGAPIVLNLVRVHVLLALAGAGEDRWFERVHVWSGPIAIGLLVAGLLVWARMLGMRWVTGTLATRITYSRNHRRWAIGVLVVAGAALALALREQDVSARVHDVVDRPVLLAADARTEAGTRVVGLEVDGYDVRADSDYRWFRQYFGSTARAASFTVREEGGASGDAADEDLAATANLVWAQVIVTGSRRKLEQLSPVDCFIAHGSTIYRARQVALPGGSGTLVEQRQRGNRFSALAFRQPVVTRDGKQRWRRIVLLTLAVRGEGRGSDDVDAANSRGPIERAAFRVLNVLSPVKTRPLPAGWNYADANERLMRIATTIVEDRDG